MKYNDVVKLILEAGWQQVRQKGSHRAYKHTTKTGIVTIAYYRLSDEVPKDYFWMRLIIGRIRD